MKKYLLIALLLISFLWINVKADEETKEVITTDPEVAVIEEEKKEEVSEPIVKEEVVQVEEQPKMVKATRAVTPKLTVNFVDTRVEGLEQKTKTYSLGRSNSDSNLYSYLQLPSYINNNYQVDDTKYYYVFLGWYTSDGTKIPAKKANAMDIDGVKVYAFSDSAYSWLYFDTTDVEEAKEITLYAKWSDKFYQADVDIHVYDDKAFSNEEVTHLPQWKRELPVTFTNGEGGSVSLMLDQIFSGNEHYTAFDNNTLRVDVKNTATYYTFKGYYDSKGNEIKDGYTSDVIKSVALVDENGKKQTLKITFKDSLNANVSSDVDVNIYVKWEEFTTAILEYEYIDEVGTGSGSWSNSTGGTTSYTHTFSDPSNETPETHYEFQYWKHDEIEDDQVDLTKEYKDGDEFTYSLSNKPSGWTGKITAHAYWQGDVTVKLYDDNKKLISETSSFESVTVDDLDDRDYEDFIGWVDENGNEVTERTFYPNEIGTNPELVEISLYAKYKLMRKDIEITKVWADEDNENKRPSSVTITLKANEEEVEDVELNDDNEWTYTFEKLPIYNEDGETIEYTVVENNVPEGYEVSYEETEEGFIIHNVLGQGDGELDNPQTGSNIVLYLIALLVSIIGLIGGKLCLKENN